jgi:methyl-accepting chemotaxis protein
MAEAVGLAASILQIAGAGAKLSTALYTFVGSVARADHEINDIAGDVELTANALDSVGKVFEDANDTVVISTKAVHDAKSLIKRCEEVFNEIQELIEKRRKVGKAGKKNLSALGKVFWPLKEQRIALLKGRLESAKSSLQLLLHVLQLASTQAKGLALKQ